MAEKEQESPTVLLNLGDHVKIRHSGGLRGRIVDRRALIRISAVLVDQFIASHATPPEHLILDFDATDDPVHGRQEGRFFHGYYDNYCFLPLYVFCGDELLTAYLRPSKIDASKHSRALLKLLVQRLRQAWPEVRITIRADSGFCRWRLMRWCDSHGVGYVLGLARNKALERLAIDWIHRAERQFQKTAQPQRIFGSFAYAASSWDRQRRVIVKAEHTAQGPNPRFLVVNVPGDPQELYEDVYCQRGDMENRIKEQQLDLFADRTSCHDFLANQFRLLLELGGLRAVPGPAADGVAGDGPGAGTGRDDPAEASEGGGAGGGLGPSGGLPSGQQLPVHGAVPGGLRSGHESGDAGEGRNRLSASKTGQGTTSAGWA